MATSYTIQVGEVRNVAVDFRSVLDTDETLVDDANLAVTTDTGLTLASEAVNTATLTINGDSVPSGKAITFSATAVTAGTYVIEIECDTNASPAQTIIERITMTVED
tara:strand:+ start:61 stop:381 length:321 start_codon:yes stop_codon:yes gene_type:complete